MDWFTLITIVFIYVVTWLMYTRSGGYWFLFLLWGWSHVVFFGPVTLAYVLCMIFMAVKKDPAYIFLIFIWDWSKFFLLSL